MEASIQTHALSIIAILITLIQFSIHMSCSPITTPPLPINKYTKFIKTSCNITTYPKLCYDSLSRYANEIKTDPKQLVIAALNVTLHDTKSTSRLFNNMSKSHNLTQREAAAMADCIEEGGDSVYELRRSIGEMCQINGSNFYEIIGDVQTWSSAALTDDDTCMDGFSDLHVVNPDVRNVVKRCINRIAHLTSNALALINNYATSGTYGTGA